MMGLSILSRMTAGMLFDRWSGRMSIMLIRRHFRRFCPQERERRFISNRRTIPESMSKYMILISNWLRQLASNLSRRGGIESDDIIWDGTNDKGKLVANGVYFYQIKSDSGKDLWGKVVVIK